ncbi:MAG TPA: hypothetical protein VL382_08940 [Terriglobales bacterium]|nr:hypothetical protein [Terriglobales bacterium]
MTLRGIAFALFLSFTAVLAAQTAPRTAAPDFSGRYSFLKEGEDIQINVTDGRVDGYVTRFGDTDADQGTMLQHTFAKASLDGNNLSFTTRPVHALYYEFKGQVQRGPAKSRAEDGYYQLVGTLTEYTQKGKDVSAKSRQATFKLFADEEEAPKK